MSSGSLGDQLDDIIERMDAATHVWAAAGHPLTGPEAEARERVFLDLRAWNLRATLRTTGKAS